MEKFLKPTAIIFAMLSVILLSFSIYGAVIVSAIALMLAFLIIKDKDFSSKTLQVSLITIISAAVIGFFNFINAILSAIIGTFTSVYSSGFYSVMLSIQYFITAIMLILALVFLIIAIVMLIKKKDIPVLSCIAKLFTGEKTPRKSKNKNNETVVETTATKVEENDADAKEDDDNESKTDNEKISNETENNDEDKS